MDDKELARIHRVYTAFGINSMVGSEVGIIQSLSWFEGKMLDLCAVDLELPKGKERQWDLEKHTRSNHANRLIFTCLDPLHANAKMSFMLMEDESDGYRSSLETVLVHTRYVPRNTFDPVRVVFQKGGGINDDLIDAVVGNKRVLQFGTSNTDDYYPSFVGDFELQNLPANVIAAKHGSERRQRTIEELRKAQAMEAERKHLGWGEF